MKTVFTSRTLALFAIIALFATPMFAQGQGRGPGRMGQSMTEEDVKERVKRQTQALELSEDQEKSITDFEVGQFKKNQVEMQKFQGDREKMREHMRGQRELRDKKYEEVLTPEQLEKYKNQQEERRQQMQERRQQNQDGDGNDSEEGSRPDRGRGRG